MKIGIVGGGTVGKATARTYLEHHEVRVHDVVKERRTHSKLEVMECDVVFVCLPTPVGEDGSLDVTYLGSFLSSIRGHQGVVVIKSTVPIGTTDSFRDEFELPGLVHSPEFLTARCAETDAHLPARNIVGGEGTKASEVVGKLYLDRFPGVPLHVLTNKESEAVKLVQNAFFAVKVGFFNEARDVCDHLGLYWDRVIAAVLGDGRIAHSHTKVPGPDGRRGFGGTCLPKDLGQFAIHAGDGIARAALLANVKRRSS